MMWQGVKGQKLPDVFLDGFPGNQRYDGVEPGTIIYSSKVSACAEIIMTSYR